MSFAQFVTFDFVEGNYTLKFTQRSQNKVDLKKESKLTYRNEMNALSFPNLSAMEFNIFFTICYFASKHIKKNGGISLMIKKSDNDTDDFIQLSFNDLRIFLPQIKNKKRFYNQIVKFVLYKLKYIGFDKFSFNDIKKLKNYKECEVRGAPFIKEYFVSEDKEILGVKLSSLTYSMFGEIKNFMSFDMNEFCSFENKYTKTFFRLLKEYENGASETGEDSPSKKSISMSKDEFERFMDASPSEHKSCLLERKIIVPSIKEINLKSLNSNGVNKSYSFKNVDYERIYADNKNTKMRKVKGFRFIFEKRND